MIANYHTHTDRCGHADGTDEAYVQNALEAGVQILGFSDHTPYFFPGDYYSGFRMRPERFGDYCQSVNALKEAYKGKVDIHLGVEAEYYPQLFSRLLTFLQDNGVEYLLLGQHYIGNEIHFPHSSKPTAEEENLKTYCYQTMDAMNTGLFSYFAHPDMFCFVGDRKIYERYMTELCREAKACGIPLELNMLGLREGRKYPSPPFWELAAREGCDAVIGIDAHAPWHIADGITVQKGEKLLKELGITLLESVPLRKIT